MKIIRQLEILEEEIKKLLLSGKNYSIFVDIKRSQVIYFKYVENNNYVKINLKREFKDEE